MCIKNYLYCSAIIFCLVSCVGAKKMDKVTVKLKDMQSQQALEDNKVSSIASVGESKLADRKIDSNINKRLNDRLSSMKQDLDSVNKEIANLQSLSSDVKTFRKSYKKDILPKLEQLDLYKKNYNDRLKIYMMMEEGLNLANYTPFDLAAFFGPGLYSIPYDQEEIAVRSFSPMVDSVMNFSHRYENTPRTATLVILGYADGQDINPDKPLYNTLTTMLNRTDISKEQLNTMLSQLRAIELIKHLTNIFNKKVPPTTDLNGLKIEYIGQGKGEEYPNPAIKDYKEDDERRRIVLCYWIVLPDVK
ncbi:hypothetical protein BH11BAC4_BH11BAC4_16730 [soil metagenome]